MRGAEGKALMVRRWASLGSDPEDAARRYAGAGFRWAAPITLAHGGAEAVRKNRDPAYYRALRRRGVSIWPLWILPTPSTWRDELVPFLDHARSVGSVGVILDPEAEFRGEHEEARAFAREAREQANARGLVLAVTSYGTPANLPDFPWNEFGESAELGIAQLYDRDDKHAPGYFARGLRQWRSHGFPEVIPAGSTWSHADMEQKTDRNLRRHLAEIPRSSGVILWTMPEIAARVWRIVAAWRPAGSSGAAGSHNAGTGVILLVLAGLGAAAFLGRT